MKSLKYLAIALFAIMMVSCGDNEPKNTFTREFNMIYPQLPVGHKFISKIEKEDAKGTKIVATASYDGDHLKSVHVVTNYGTGGSNEETIYFDYDNGAIICDKSIQDVTYSFEVNAQGAITQLKNVSTSRTAAALQYSYSNELELAQIVSPSSTDVTKVAWLNGKLMQWESTGVNKKDSVVYEYGTGAPINKGCIDVEGNESFTFTKYVCAIMRNAGLFGATSAYLPTVMKKGYDYSQTVEADSDEPLQLKRYDITYELDSDGYVKSYTTNETPKYTVRITYR
ncbi:MAG: DUF4595 domain-containing protein [Muribaculaceae bacterium]|nr:DUF4595 domain-containing protein [Muribaculaceae bacterium]